LVEMMALAFRRAREGKVNACAPDRWGSVALARGRMAKDAWSLPCACASRGASVHAARVGGEEMRRVASVAPHGRSAGALFWSQGHGQAPRTFGAGADEPLLLSADSRMAGR
jgi:hypothetical protein